MRGFLLATVSVMALLAAVQATAAMAGTFYVSPTGNDASAGTSAATAWRSVSKVNGASLAPGDTVLFAGSATFGGTLSPRGSGAPDNPITFSSYGTGDAVLSGGIQLASQSWLTFDGLTVDTGAWQSAGPTDGIRTSDSGSGVQNVVVQNSTFRNLEIGLQLSNHRDRYWSVSGNLIQYTRDSGILIFDPYASTEVGGSDMTFTGNQILDTGIDSGIGWKKHGAYDIGTNITWRNNTIRRFQDSGLSIRARAKTIDGNTITDGPYAIDISPYDPVGSTTTITDNKLLRASEAGIQINVAGEVPNPESYVITGNTISTNGSARGIRIVGTRGSVSVANNIVVTKSAEPFKLDQRPGGGVTESNNNWYTLGRLTIGFLAADYSTIAAYQSASGLGRGDTSVNPGLDANGAPAAGSPAAAPATTASAPAATQAPAATPAPAATSAPPAGSGPEAPAPAGSTSASATAPASTSVPLKKRRMKIVLPRSASAGTAFTLRASGLFTRPSTIKFVVDGQQRCTTAKAPFSCTLTASRGWHNIRLLASWNGVAAKTATARLQIS